MTKPKQTYGKEKRSKMEVYNYSFNNLFDVDSRKHNRQTITHPMTDPIIQKLITQIEYALTGNYGIDEEALGNILSAAITEAREEGYAQGQEDAFRGRIENLKTLEIKETVAIPKEIRDYVEKQALLAYKTELKEKIEKEQKDCWTMIELEDNDTHERKTTIVISKEAVLNLIENKQ